MDIDIKDKIKSTLSPLNLANLKGDNKTNDLATFAKKEKKIKKKSAITKEELSDLKPLEIGFRVESKYEVFKRNFRKKFAAFIENLKVSGFFSDTWLWNLIFINLLGLIITTVVISQNIANLPEFIGLNTDDDRYLDLVISKNWLFLIPLTHIVAIIFFLYFGVKSQKKLNHLFISSFFQIIVVIGFELIALRNFIVYFL